MLYDSTYITFMKWQNYRNGEQLWLPGINERVGVGGKWIWLEKDNNRDPCGDGNVLYPDCINVNTRDVILYYSCIRCYTGGNWEKDIWVSVLFLQLYVNLQLFHNKMFNWKRKPVAINQNKQTIKPKLTKPNQTKPKNNETNKIVYFYLLGLL